MKAVLPLTVGPAGTTEAPGMGGSTLPVPTPVPMGPWWESGGHRVEMVCVSPGPADIHFVWEKNGRELEMCVPMQTHALPDGRAHVLSWLRDAIRESAEYRCSVLSSAGNGTSKVRVTVVRHGERPPPLRHSQLRRRACWCPGGRQEGGACGPCAASLPDTGGASAPASRHPFTPWRVWDAGPESPRLPSLSPSPVPRHVQACLTSRPHALRTAAQARWGFPARPGPGAAGSLLFLGEVWTLVSSAPLYFLCSFRTRFPSRWPPVRQRMCKGPGPPPESLASPSLAWGPAFSGLLGFHGCLCFSDSRFSGFPLLSACESLRLGPC